MLAAERRLPPEEVEILVGGHSAAAAGAAGAALALAACKIIILCHKGTFLYLNHHLLGPDQMDLSPDCGGY